MSEENNTITGLRTELFATIRALRDPTDPMDIKRAQAVGEVAGRIIDSVKAETEYVRQFGRATVPVSGFIPAEKQDTLSRQATTPVPGRGLPPPGPKGSL